MLTVQTFKRGEGIFVNIIQIPNISTSETVCTRVDFQLSLKECSVLPRGGILYHLQYLYHLSITKVVFYTVKPLITNTSKEFINSIKLIEKLPRRHLINSFDVFVIKGFTVPPSVSPSI